MTELERIEADIRSLDAQIAANDKQIEEAERRQELRRRQGDDWYRRRLKCEAQLERETAPLVKPRGKCVVEVAPNGVAWEV